MPSFSYLTASFSAQQSSQQQIDDLLFEDPTFVEFDCHRQFGKENYTFFVPLEVGDFVVTLWTRGGTSSLLNSTRSIQFLSTVAHPDLLFAIAIYENGNLISIKKDKRFHGLPWAHKMATEGGGWTQELFSKNEIDQILYDLKNIQPNFQQYHESA